MDATEGVNGVLGLGDRQEVGDGGTAREFRSLTRCMRCGRLLTFLPGMGDTGVCDKCDLKPFPDLPSLHSLENIERAPLEVLDQLWFDLAWHVGMLDVYGKNPPRLVKVKLEKTWARIHTVKATLTQQKRTAAAFVSGIAVMAFLTKREFTWLSVFADYHGPLGRCDFAPLTWPESNPKNVQKISAMATREVMCRLGGDVAAAILLGESGDTEETDELLALVHLVVHHERAARTMLKRLGERVRERLTESRSRAALEVLYLTLLGNLEDRRSIMQRRKLSGRKAKRIIREAMRQ